MVKRGRGRPKVSFFDQSPEFFELYIPDHNSQRLRIPPTFIKHFNGTIPDKAILKDLGGKFWHVGMEEAENGLFIKNGWQGFVSDNCLEKGDFLVLRYNGSSSSFTVRIFGKDGCKKEEAVAIEKTTIPFIPVKSIKIEEESEAEETFGKCSRICKQKFSEIGLKKPEKSRGSQEVSRLKSPSTSKIVEKHKLFEAADSVLTKNPSFTAYRQPSKVLNIPSQYRHIELEKAMVLLDQKGESWPVTVCFYKDDRRVLSKGWMDFCQKKRVKDDDKCILEFVHESGRKCKEFRVHIERARARTRKHRRQWTKRQPRI